MNKLEVLKAQYQIIRDKLMLFSAGVGGSFVTLLNGKIPFIGSVMLYATLTFSFFGVLTNLQKAGKIQKELNQLKEELENG